MIASNYDWYGAPQMVNAFHRVGAFDLDTGSKDAAFVATLAPGAYSVQLAGTGSETGAGLVEVYELR